MANLSPDDRVIIAKHPLRNSLDQLREPLRKIEQNYEPVSLSYDGAVDSFDQEPQKAISQLLHVLQGHEVALDLRSKTENEDIASELSTLFRRVRNGNFSYEHYRALSRLVIRKASDLDIWNAVLNLISTLSRITTPPSRPSFTSSYKETPWSFNSSGFADTSEHRSQVDDALKEELLPSLRLDIPDLVNAIFGQVPRLDELAEEVFNTCQEGDAPLYIHGSGWTKWHPSAKEELVLEWLQSLMARFMALIHERDLHPAHCRWIYQGPRVYLDGSTAKRKMDVGITAHHEQSKRGDERGDEKIDIPIFDWAQILVAGELKSNPNEDRQTSAWLDLATYAREVFRTQDRRFVLGFTLCGSLMRLWQFDRSGSSGSSSFDINKDGLKFVHVMLGYHLMNDVQLGLDPTIRQSDSKCYVEITRNDQIERLILTRLIKKQAMIAGRATTCWKAYRDGDKSKESLIIKDSWQYEERSEEGELIKKATDKGVQNIARYYHHETVQIDGKNDDIIENVRRGLMKTCGRNSFRQRLFVDSEVSTSESLGSSLSRKRSSSLVQITLSPNKRSRSSRRSRDSATSIHNRIRRRVITRDAGKTIQEATSLVAVLNGLVGAISGHESLLDAGILHRDISHGNIMLTEKEDDGFLIDLDLAVRLNANTASGAPSKTGTKVFMAIGALKGEHHNFMHDLESFFWVLFWICIHWDEPHRKRRIVTEFKDWNNKSIKELAKLKIGLVLEDDFSKEMKVNFSEYCKPLIPCMQELWKEVFPGGKRWLSEDRELYFRVADVLKRAREDFADKLATL